MKLQKNKLTALILIMIAMLLPLIFSGSSYFVLIFCFIEIYIIGVSGLDILFGYCGQVSLGHAAFYAIGAYGSVLLHKYTGMPVLVTMIIGSALGAVVGAIVAYSCSKLVFHFLSLATQAVGEIIYILVSHSPNNVTGNYVGMYTDPVNLFGFKLDSEYKFFYFALGCVVIFLLAKQFLVNSKTGRAFTAIRENVHAADGMGINVRAYKVKAFATSAFYTAFAGAMFAHLVEYVSPDSFLYKQSVMFLTMLLFGGSGSLLGPILGASAVLLVNESLRSLQDYQMLVYGIMMLIVIVVMPGGIFGLGKGVMAKIKNKKLNGGEANA
ncbi:MAG TPA: branched-chain amino acid ABC transporter permease [Candidatus Pelethocola excrementipullorum]|nr:branched-chain amino acid ABC transporter permease [Candidatus Pelethocola excrementipullorum]